MVLTEHTFNLFLMLVLFLIRNHSMSYLRYLCCVLPVSLGCPFWLLLRYYLTFIYDILLRLIDLILTLFSCQYKSMELISMCCPNLYSFKQCSEMRTWWLSNWVATYCLYYYALFRRIPIYFRDRRDRMVVRFATTYAISAYHHWCEIKSQGEMYSIMW